MSARRPSKADANQTFINRLVANKLAAVGASVVKPSNASGAAKHSPTNGVSNAGTSIHRLPKPSTLRTDNQLLTASIRSADKKLPKLGTNPARHSTTINDITSRINNIFQQNSKLQSQPPQHGSLPVVNRLQPQRSQHSELYNRTPSARIEHDDGDSTSVSTLKSYSAYINGVQLNNNTLAAAAAITVPSVTPNGIRSTKVVKRGSYSTKRSASVVSVESAGDAADADSAEQRVTKITLKQALSLQAGTPLIVNSHEGRVMYIGTLSFLSGTVIGLKLSHSTGQSLPLVEQKHVSLSHFTQRDIKQVMRCEAEYAYFTRAHVSTFALPGYKNAVTQRWLKVIAAVQCIIRLRYLNTVTLDKKLEFRKNQVLQEQQDDRRLSLTSFDPVELNRLKYYQLDAFSATVNKQKTYDVLSLAHVLTRNNTVHTQSDKIRVLYRWCCDNINYTYDPNNKQYDTLQNSINKDKVKAANAAIVVPQPKASISDVVRLHSIKQSYDSDSDTEQQPTVPNYDPSVVLKKRAADAYGYATLFNALCHSIGIECVTIHGVSKEFDAALRIGDKLQINHSWNAVYVADSNAWFVIDVCLSSHYPAQAQPITKPYDKIFSNAYYMCNTELFSKNHLPVVVTTASQNSKKCLELCSNAVKAQCLQPGFTPVTLQTLNDVQWIYRNYLDYQVSLITQLDPYSQLIKCEQSFYTFSLQLPSSEEIAVELTMPSSLQKQTRQHIGQCYTVAYTVLHENSYIQRADLSFVFPAKGQYYAIIKSRHYNYNTNSYSPYEPLMHIRLACSNGFNDVRTADYESVALGYPSKLTLLGRDNSIEQYIQLLKPSRGYFETNSVQRFSVQASTDVVKIVVVNNGQWVQLQPSGGAQPAANNRKSVQIYEGELRLDKQYTDIQIYYQLASLAQYNLIYSFNTDNTTIPSATTTSTHATEMIKSVRTPKVAAKPVNRTKTGSKVAFQLSDKNVDLDESIDSVDSAPSTVDTSKPAAADNKHGKIVLDSRGVCFEKLIHVTDVKCGKRTVTIRVSVGSDNTALRAEVRSSWTSGVKLNDANAVKIRALTTGQYEVQCTVQHAGEYVVHCFAVTNGTAVNRFAFMLFVKL